MSTNVSATSSSPTRVRGTILVVEDDDGVRQFVRLGLEHAGYTIVCATDGDQALELYQANPDRFDLVLTDVIMPTRTGPELAAELHRIRPGQRVVFMSGFTGATIIHPADLPPGMPFLEKPFTLDRLLHVITGALAGG
jgi:DNA-binding NtrC family response regulator